MSHRFKIEFVVCRLMSDVKSCLPTAPVVDLPKITDTVTAAAAAAIQVLHYSTLRRR